MAVKRDHEIACLSGLVQSRRTVLVGKKIALGGYKAVLWELICNKGK